jgi:hypothetical protein
MSKLLQRLSDATKSGVYRTSRVDEIQDALRGSALKLAGISLAGVTGKDALLARMAQALSFPAWFGGNWDALEDCLSDLSWLPAQGYVLLFEESSSLPSDERGILIDILASVAASWQERRRPFFDVLVDGSLQLPDLYNSRR